MSKISLKLICTLSAFSLTIGLLVGAISLIRSSELLTREIESKIVSSAERYSNSFNAKFNHTEGLVDSLAAQVSVTFDADRYNENPDRYVSEYMEYLNPIVKESISSTKLAHGLYVTFNPELTHNNDEVWYSYNDGQVSYVQAKFDKHQRDFTEPILEEMLYFFDPIQQNRPCWTGPYHDKDIALNVLSYSRAIYVDDLFVGIAGADITTDDTIDIMDEMKMYKGGYALLLDENMNIIIHPTFDKDLPISQIPGNPMEESMTDMKTAHSGVLRYHLNGEKKILGFSQLANGWTLAITQPEIMAFSPIVTLNSVMAILGILIFAFILMFSAIFASVISRPIEENQAALEEENRQKEVMLIYQSRQAKIGEMVGNITHQWKQPLNSINLILINLLDAYRYEELNEAKLEKSVEKVNHIIKKMSETISDFTNFLKPSQEKMIFSLKESIDMALSLMEESIEYHQIKICCDLEPNISAYGNPNEFAHVVFNVINNSRDAILESNPKEKIIKIHLESVTDQQNTPILSVLSITNLGGNITEQTLPYIFDPYFTTKGSSGTGLGLYISKIIIEQRMEGTIRLSNLTEGVSCIITLPTK